MKIFLKNARNRITNFKEKFEQVKDQPKSKRKSLLLGFTTALGIFGITLLTPILPAVANDIPLPANKPTVVAPINQSAIIPSQEIVKGLSGIAASVCALAVTSGSFIIGATCGIVVVIGILKAQGK